MSKMSLLSYRQMAVARKMLRISGGVVARKMLRLPGWVVQPALESRTGSISSAQSRTRPACCSHPGTPGGSCPAPPRQTAEFNIPGFNKLFIQDKKVTPSLIPPSIHYIYLSNYMSIYLITYLSIHHSIYPSSVYPFSHLSIHSSIHPAICLSIYEYIHSSITTLIHISIHLPTYPCIHLFTY